MTRNRSARKSHLDISYIYIYIYIHLGQNCKNPIRRTVSKKEYFIVVPYLGTLSGKIQKQIKNVFRKLSFGVRLTCRLKRTL